MRRPGARVGPRWLDGPAGRSQGAVRRKGFRHTSRLLASAGRHAHALPERTAMERADRTRIPEGLKRRWPDIRPEDKAAVAAVMERGVLGGVGAPEMTALEEEWAAFVGRSQGLLFNSGTAAIHAALHGIGIQPGDEVITTSYTFAGTWQPI